MELPVALAGVPEVGLIRLDCDLWTLIQLSSDALIRPVVVSEENADEAGNSCLVLQ